MGGLKRDEVGKIGRGCFFTYEANSKWASVQV